MPIMNSRVEPYSSNDACYKELGKKLKIALRSWYRLAHGLRLSSVAALITVASTCHAQTSVAAGDSGLGAHSPSITTCVACHGALGAGSGGAPRLAGKNPDYLAHALSMFKAGTRKNAVMQAVAHDLSDSDMRELALYFSKQRPPLARAPQAPSPSLVMAGKQLAEMGAGADVQACFSCHAAGGKGNGARFPSIAGEPAAFIVDRLHEFQARAKAAPAKPGTMTAVAAQLSETQIKEAAAYLSVIEP
jgi:cytochrome c553